MDGNNQSINDKEDDNERSEVLIRAFSQQNDQLIEDKIQHATQTQGLQPRRLKHRKFNLKNQDITTVTTGRPNTRLFSSNTSQ